MQKNQVAVLDIGSSKITAVIGEKGINSTFILKAKKDFLYDGFLDQEFLNVEQFKSLVTDATRYLTDTMAGVDTIYVGVPGAFSKVMVKDAQITFEKKKKITPEDINALFDNGYSTQFDAYSLMNRSAIVYELNDYRRVANPVGELSELLKAKLSFVLVSNYFMQIVGSSVMAVSNVNVEYVSVALAEAMYLLDDETRDRIAIIVDVGYINTTFSLIQGDGVIYQNSFNYGGGFIAGAIAEAFDLDFENAEFIKKHINLCRNYKDAYDLIEADNGQLYNANKIREIIFASLDQLCENISNSMENSGYIIPEYVPILITGGGICGLRGAKERISNRLSSTVEIIAPKAPMMDSPYNSSILSLLGLVLD